MAKESEFASYYQDSELGAMPPLGPLYGQRVFVDRRLAGALEVAFSAGSHHDAIRMRYKEFERIVHPTVAEFAWAPPSLAASRHTDPVCGARIHLEAAVGRSEFLGEMYYFCCQSCKMEFDDNPHAYGKD